MEALVSIGGYSLPEPSSYSAVTSTIVDSARNVQGYVVGSVIRPDVAKIELSWKYLTAREWANILSTHLHDRKQHHIVRIRRTVDPRQQFYSQTK